MGNQTTIAGVPQSNASVMADRTDVPLSEKIKLAIKLLQDNEPVEGYYLCYSGGKDSGCILQLAKMSTVRFAAFHNLTTIDPPELVRFVYDTPYVHINRPRIPMMRRLVEKTNGPPTRLARWCCSEYKEHGGDGRVKIVGIRAAESPKRAVRWREVIDKTICPILYWTDDDVWAFHKKFQLRYCSLYDEGFKRLGCIGCPLGGPEAQNREFARWPRYERLWKNAVRDFWMKHHGTPTKKGGVRWFEKFGSWESLWDWWRSGGSSLDKTLFDDEACQQELIWTNPQ